MKPLLIIALLASCGGDPDFKTKHGLEVYTRAHPVTQTEIEIATDSLIVYFPGLYDLSPSSPEMQVFVQSAPEICSSSTSKICEGEYRHKLWIRYTHEDCIADSVFIDELMHHLAYLMKWKNDGEHDDPRFYEAVVNSKTTIKEEVC